MTTKLMIVGEAWGLISVGKSHKAIVSLEDIDKVSTFNWSLLTRPNGNKYAHRKVCGTTMFLHQQILGTPKWPLVIDHVNRDGLDCRRENLRIVDRRANALNSERSNNASIIERHGNRFRVRPFFQGKRLNLGSFISYEEALLVLKEFRDAN